MCGSDSGSSIGYAGPIGFLAGKPEYESNAEWIGNGVTGGVFNALGNPVGSAEQRRMAEEQAAKAADTLRRQQTQRDANIAKVREAYGVGTSATAGKNARTIDDAIRAYYQSSLSSGLSSADNQFATTGRTNRQNLARLGQLGSGNDAASTSGTLADYIKARQSAVANAASARDRLSNNLVSQRLNYENAISGGSVANPDFSSIAANRDATLANAQANVTPAAIGSLFNTAANVYTAGQVQGAMGNQGLRSFNAGSNRGSIT